MSCVLLPPGHPLLRQKHVTIDDLRKEKLITMPRGSGMRNRLQPIFDEYSYYPKILYESDNLNVITQAVKSGMGYAFVTEAIMMDYPELWDNVAKIDITDVVGHCGLSYNKHSVGGRNASHFKGFILDFFNDLSENAKNSRPAFLKSKIKNRKNASDAGGDVKYSYLSPFLSLLHLPRNGKSILYFTLPSWYGNTFLQKNYSFETLNPLGLR